MDAGLGLHVLGGVFVICEVILAALSSPCDPQEGQAMAETPGEVSEGHIQENGQHRRPSVVPCDLRLGEVSRHSCKLAQYCSQLDPQ